MVEASFDITNIGFHRLGHRLGMQDQLLSSHIQVQCLSRPIDPIFHLKYTVNFTNLARNVPNEFNKIDYSPSQRRRYKVDEQSPETKFARPLPSMTQQHDNQV